MNKILVSFSGGRTSALMAKLIQEHPKYKDYEKLFCYANTGKESEATLEFIDRCDKEFGLDLVWLEADVIHEKGVGTIPKVVDFDTASRNGEPFEEVIKKYGLPSKMYRHCTREMKEYPIAKYARSILGNDYVIAIGIRADEKHRLGSDPKKVYPLAELGFTEEIVRNWWDRQSFDLDLKDYQGNCDFCFLKSIRKKLTLAQENPKSLDWWNKMEVKYSKPYQDKFDVYRDMSIDDLLEKSKFPFNKAVDQHELRSQQNSLFEPNLDLDLEFDCFCKNT